MSQIAFPFAIGTAVTITGSPYTGIVCRLQQDETRQLIGVRYTDDSGQECVTDFEPDQLAAI